MTVDVQRNEVQTFKNLSYVANIIIVCYNPRKISTFAHLCFIFIYLLSNLYKISSSIVRGSNYNLSESFFTFRKTLFLPTNIFVSSYNINFAAKMVGDNIMILPTIMREFIISMLCSHLVLDNNFVW